jgi:hypothetical protein
MNGYGENLLFHIACEGRRSVEAIQMLLEGNPKKRTSHMKNNKGQLPINIVGYSNNAPVEVVKLLLGVSVGNQIEQLSLQGWRIGMEELVNAMTENEENKERIKRTQKIYEWLSK